MSQIDKLKKLWAYFVGESAKPPITSTHIHQVLNPQEIALRKSKAIVLPPSENKTPLIQESKSRQSLITQLQVEAMNLGFIFTQEAVLALVDHTEIHTVVLGILQKLVAADKVWQPMYPNFPKQVFKASEEELYLNAIMHYLSWGQWQPKYPKASRLPRFNQPHFKTIGLISHHEFMKVFQELLSANSSLPAIDKDILFSYLSIFSEAELLELLPKEIPFKETRCQLIADALYLDYSYISSLEIQNTTDILRIATRLSGGDISLAANTLFRLKKSQRRWLVTHLEKTINESDLARHKKKWKRLFHCLHIGSFKNAPKTQALASKLRNSKLNTDRTQLEALLLKPTVEDLLPLVRQKPGEFARKLDHLLRIFPESKAQAILNGFFEVIDQVDTRVLLQMLGHFSHRFETACPPEDHGQTQVPLTRVILPKGEMAKVKVLKTPLPAISTELLKALIKSLKTSLIKRFSTLQPLGKVWIDPHLKKCPIPLQMRNASEGLQVIQRGTRLSMGNQRILRFFVHWVGEDIDLSACFLTDNLVFHSEIAYYHLKSTQQGYRSVHSGDITHAPAPDGACEFIDIDLESITNPEIRYIAMDVRVYAGQPFPKQEANVGWMFREGLGQSGEIFDAQTVEQRIAIGSATRSSLVAFFDIRKREVIWLDVMGSSHALQSGNNVASNRFNIKDLLEASLNFKQVSLYDLFKLHARARGERVLKKEEAEVLIDRDIIYQYTHILSDYMA